jgi:hypothetical protein
MEPQVYTVQMRWLAPQVGGRQMPPSGPVYAPTARLAEVAIDQEFSVAFRLLGTQRYNEQILQEAEMRLANLDLMSELGPRLTVGRQLLIHEGKRVVGLCTINSMRPITPQDKAAISFG